MASCCQSGNVYSVDNEGQVWAFSQGSIYNPFHEKPKPTQPNQGHRMMLTHKEKGILDYIVPVVIGIVNVAGGNEHVVFLDMYGDVWSYGKGDLGQLGLGSTKQVTVPTRIEDISSIRSVACGGLHTVCIDSDNAVYSFGANTSSQLGLGHFINKRAPCKSNLEAIKQVACGHYYSIFLTFNGDILFSGNNTSNVFGLKENDTPRISTPLKHPNISNIKDIASGDNHIVLLTNCNEAIVLTKNNGRKSVPNIIDISASSSSTLLLQENGKVLMATECSNFTVLVVPNSKYVSLPYIVSEEGTYVVFRGYGTLPRKVLQTNFIGDIININKVSDDYNLIRKDKVPIKSSKKSARK